MFMGSALTLSQSLVFLWIRVESFFVASRLIHRKTSFFSRFTFRLRKTRKTRRKAVFPDSAQNQRIGDGIKEYSA